eukprot:9245406-Karenia_brevis.AAC.1
MIKVVGKGEHRRERQRKADVEFKERISRIRVCRDSCCQRSEEHRGSEDRERYVCGIESGDAGQRM